MALLFSLPDNHVVQRLQAVSANRIALTTPHSSLLCSLDEDDADAAPQIVTTLPQGTVASTVWIHENGTAVLCSTLSAATRNTSALEIVDHSTRSGKQSEPILVNLPGCSTTEPLTDVQVVFGSILAVQTSTSVCLYALDPSVLTKQNTQQATPIHLLIDLPLYLAGSATDDCSVMITPSYDDVKKEVVVAQTYGRKVHVRIVSIDEDLKAKIRVATPPSGLDLPSVIPSNSQFLSWTVNWRQSELLCLFNGGGLGTHVACSLSLWPLAGSVLSTWVRQPSFLSASTRSTVANASALVCVDGDVWALSMDATSAVLKNLTSSKAKEVSVPLAAQGAARVEVLAMGESLYVIASNCLYRIGNAPGKGSSTKASLCDWLTGTMAGSRAIDSASTKSAEEVIHFVLNPGKGSPGSSVVRDHVFVVMQGDCPSAHLVLDALVTKSSSTAALVQAVLQYSAMAHTLHPFTVMEMMRHVATKHDLGGVLALASILAHKTPLRLGGLARMASLASSARESINHVGGSPVEKRLGQKTVLAVICEAAVAALATGALGAAQILFSVADVMISIIYGDESTQPVATMEKDAVARESSAEATILQAVQMFSSFSEWSLTIAATTLGVISAHVGKPNLMKKEAALPDGKAHPIHTSRNVDIEPLRITRAETN